MFPLPAILKTKAFLFTTGGLLLALAVSLGLLTVTASRLQASKTALASTQSSLTLATEIASQRALELQGRDQVIQAQTVSIESLAASKGASRVIYLDGVSRANQEALRNEEEAKKILQEPAAPPSDLCVAARDLIEQELLNVR